MLLLRSCTVLNYTDEKVTGGSVTIKAKFGIIPVLSTTIPLCTFAKEQAGVPCPFAAGEQTFKISKAVPSFIPSVSVYTSCTCIYSTEKNFNVSV